ncbi:glutaminase A [Candidatus Entotheonella palauensis]|uniref:Glutaminase n=1 Tax=Candidatus Entotheonella gemina TaxID=1429439 RepID=W4LUB1_9BACT|nr:glutaminase A [Candidatus Entotheonella palauensis]ETX01578.1 MAG: hypothetical protein ETSY2_36950 [Candidatus Entotheonella gemina]
MSAADRAGLKSPIRTYLEKLHATYVDLHDGQVASYIPELSHANPNWFGICVATTDGYVYEVGDSRQTFTMQSISKPFVYGLALEDHGKDAVFHKIGVEPSGDAFNSISLYPDSGRPFNPMINAGAIATTGMINGEHPAEKLQRLLDMVGVYCGHPVEVDQRVYESERSTGHRNRAIGHMLRNFEILTDDPEPALDLYFQQCSILVTCRDLAIMAVTLANGGLNPISGQRAVHQPYVEPILSIMSTCGMYNSAGEWIYDVGMPAKSGVSGGVLAVLPGQLGIAVFSPPLDQRSNSVRGIRVCEDMSQDFNLHLFHAPVVAKSVIRTSYNASQVTSQRSRRDHEEQLLQEQGHRIRVYDLQGDLLFSTVEVVLRDIMERHERLDFIILDLKHVTSIDTTASSMLCDLLHTLEAQPCMLLFSNIEPSSPFAMSILGREGSDGSQGPVIYEDHDLALEWCENQLLARYLGTPSGDAAIPLAEHVLCQGLSERDLNHLQTLLEPLSFAPGERILETGHAPDYIYLLTRGEVSVTIELADGKRKRLSTLPAGMAFGEMALIERAPRSADVTALTPVACYALPIAAFDRLQEINPSLRMMLLTNLLRHVSGTLRRLTEKVGILTG